MRNLYLLLLQLCFAAAFAQGVPPTVASNPGTSGDEIMSTASLQTQPEYPGGIKEFYKYVQNNFRMPEVDTDMTARILIQFVVEKDGSMSDFKVVRDPGFGFGEEAVRLLKSVPKKWKPGVQNGKLVRCRYVLPITLNVTGSDDEAPKKE